MEQKLLCPLNNRPRLSKPCDCGNRGNCGHGSGKIDREIIDIQSGNYLGEDDVVRLDDSYGRAK